MEKKKVIGEFVWLPWEERKDRLGLPLAPRRKQDPRRPLLWLTRKKLEEKPGSELYLVNYTNETLDYVEVQGMGFAYYGEDKPVKVQSEKIRYDSVEHNAAVKIDEYDIYYDPEFYLTVLIEVKSKKLGTLMIVPPYGKGGPREMILLWDNMKPEEYVMIKRKKD